MQNTNKKINTMVKIAMLSAVATVLMLFEFPLPFIAPTFYELDFSEVPVLVGAFALGPWACIIIEGMKILLNFILNGTITAGVGEVANFVMGVCFVFPAALVYKKSKTRKSAIIGLLVGTALLLIVGSLINIYVMIPAYGAAFGMPQEAFIGMAAAIWPAIDSMAEFALYCVVPFNLLKCILVSGITILIYKKLSPILKK